MYTHTHTHIYIIYIYIKQSLLKAWTGFQKVEARRFHDNRHMEVVRLSARHTGRLYPKGNIPITHFFYRLVRSQGHSAAGMIMSMKKKSMTLSEIEPATFRLAAYCLNQPPCIYTYICIYLRLDRFDIYVYIKPYQHSSRNSNDIQYVGCLCSTYKKSVLPCTHCS